MSSLTKPCRNTPSAVSESPFFGAPFPMSGAGHAQKMPLGKRILNIHVLSMLLLYWIDYPIHGIDCLKQALDIRPPSSQVSRFLRQEPGQRTPGSTAIWPLLGPFSFHSAFSLDNLKRKWHTNLVLMWEPNSLLALFFSLFFMLRYIFSLTTTIY